MAPTIIGNTSNQTWSYWTSSATTNDTTWLSWNGVPYANTSASTQVWEFWVDQTGMSAPVVVNSQGGVRQPTPEEIETRRRKAEEQQREFEAARAKAKELLISILNRQQQREFAKHGHFHVQTRDGERVYRFKPGQAPMRIKGEDGQQWQYCIHPRQSFPAEDTVAALKLMIEDDEDEFLRVANASRTRVSA